MPTRSEAVISVAETAVGSTSAADTIVSAYNDNNEGFQLVNSVGQVIASVVGLVKILAPISLQANTFAGTVTFLKIVMDLHDGKRADTGDVLNLVGNVAGIVATVTILAGTAPVWVTAVATGVGIAAGAAGIYSGSNFDKLKTWSNNMFQDFWPTAPVPTTTNDLYLDSLGNFRPYDQILNDPTADFGAIRIESSSWGSPSSIVAISAPDPGDGGGVWTNPQRVTIQV